MKQLLAIATAIIIETLTSVAPVLAASNANIGTDINANLAYYLPKFTNYNKNLPTPESVLGYQVGEWHARPEQIERYFQQLAEVSPRVKLQVYAYSHEKRPLFLAYISSEKNINNLESIRKKHLLMENKSDRPAVTWLGYSIHGNEASGSNASLLLAYHLAAAKDKQALAQLDQQIIIIDPMLNPDGLARFATWANMYKSKNPNKDPNTQEHHESWPNGRTNHYWFDLNRDWLLLQHPESQGRVKMFHQWKPNVLADFHEMATDSTYFFQPGVKSRQNPLTPEENFQLTAKIAKYHAAALDKIGSLYFSKENFDDFYYGKGSTYPDINGGIGILLEQASSRGHLQQSINGDVSFPFAIKNHLTTSLSTIKAVQENKKSLLQYQRNFYKKAKLDAKANKIRAVVYASNDDYRLAEFNQLLTIHQIKYYKLASEVNINGQAFNPNQSYVIPIMQPQSSLIQSIFEKRENFKDNTFYDVSSWNMPLAFGLDYQMLNRSDFNQELLSNIQPVSDVTFEPIDEKTVALAFNWQNFATANLLNYLHQNKIKARVVSKRLKVATRRGKHWLNQGDIVIPIKSQNISRDELSQLLNQKLLALKLKPQMINSGLAITGPDLGSPSVPLLKPVRPLMIIGGETNVYQAGEVWHLFDQRLEQDLSMMTAANFIKRDIFGYTHIILVDGDYDFSEKFTKKLNDWVKAGGILITQSKASKWLADQNWLSSEGKDLEPMANSKLNYSDLDNNQSEHFIGGAIVATNIDLSHPLSFGLNHSNLAIFKRGQFSFSEAKESFVSIARFKKSPLIAGYMSKANQKNLSGKTSVLVQAHGKGKLIAFTDDMNFRGFWLGSSRVFVNALYFSDMIKATAKKKGKNQDKNKKTIPAMLKQIKNKGK